MRVSGKSIFDVLVLSVRPLQITQNAMVLGTQHVDDRAPGDGKLRRKAHLHKIRAVLAAGRDPHLLGGRPPPRNALIAQAVPFPAPYHLPCRAGGQQKLVASDHIHIDMPRVEYENFQRTS